MAATNDLVANIITNKSTAATYKPINTKRVSERVCAGKPCILRGKRAGATGTVAVYGVNLSNPWRSNVADANTAFDGPVGQAVTQVLRGDGSTLAFATTLTYAAFSNYNWHIDLHQFDRYPAEHFVTGVADGWEISNVGGLATFTWTSVAQNGDGTTVAFTSKMDYAAYAPGTTSPPSSAGGYLVPIVKIGTSLKVIGTDYTVDSNAGLVRITFTSAPATGTGNVHIDFAPVNGMEFGVVFSGTPKTIWAAATAQFFDVETPSYDRLWAVLASSPSASWVTMESTGQH